jgi:uncharacterized protein
MFDWDEQKNQLNIAKHGVSFEQAKLIFDNFTVDRIDDRFFSDEIRYFSLGRVGAATILAVSHTDRNGICRIISARPALKHERRLYEQEIRKALEF